MERHVRFAALRQRRGDRRRALLQAGGAEHSRASTSCCASGRSRWPRGTTTRSASRCTRRRRPRCARACPRSASLTRRCGARRSTPMRPRRRTPARTTATADDDSIELAIELGGPLTGKLPLTVCLDDVELNDPQFEAPVAQARAATTVRVNQVGYLPGFAKIATVATKATGAGRLAAARQGRQGARERQDAPVRRGQVVGRAACSRSTSRRSTRAGKGYTLKVGRKTRASRSTSARRLQAPEVRRAGVLLPAAQRHPDRDALRRIEGVRTPRRPHRATRACRAQGSECDYSLDVSGGWYDAGDHGKYVVNGGISVWTLLNQYEALHEVRQHRRRLRRRQAEHPREQEQRPTSSTRRAGGWRR